MHELDHLDQPVDVNGGLVSMFDLMGVLPVCSFDRLDGVQSGCSLIRSSGGQTGWLTPRVTRSSRRSQPLRLLEYSVPQANIRALFITGMYYSVTPMCPSVCLSLSLKRPR